MRSFLSLITLSVLLWPLAVSAQDTKPDIDKIFSSANTLLQQKKYVEALVEYRKILALEPDLEGPLQNGAMAAFFAADYKTAKEFYLKLKASDLNSGFFRAKLVQVYQAMGDEKARDTERTELIALHNAGKDTSSLAKRPDFCREQYKIGKSSVLVYEPFVFEPRSKEEDSPKEGRFAPHYQFLIADDDGKLLQRIEVGWNFVTQDNQGIYKPSRALSAYYFDAYYPSGPWVRQTMGLSQTELSYAETKRHIQAILEGKVKASGGTPRRDK